MPGRGNGGGPTDAASRAAAAVLVAGLGLGLCACGVGAAVQPSDSGVQGTVLLGPMCPGPQRVDHPCPDQPVARTFKVFLLPPGFTGVPSPERGRLITHFASDSDGRFRVNLGAGQYLFYSDRAGSPGACQAYATVKPHTLTATTVRCDTGMR